MPAVLREREGTPGLPETWELFVQAMHSAPLVAVCCKRVMMWAFSVGRFSYTKWRHWLADL
jgi:hypothetical protein